MVKKVLLMSCLLCSGIQLASAQNVLKGRVVDHQGNPISGAKVENAKGSEQTTTDMNGQFSLETEGNVKKVNVYYMGMQTAHKKAKPDMLVKMGGINWWKQKPDKYSWFFGPQVSITSSYGEPSFGFIFGRLKNWGWYVKADVKNPSDIGKENNSIGGSWGSFDEMVSKEHTFDGKPKSSVNRWGVSAGIMRRTLGNLYVMAGAGYLENVKVWTCMEGHSFEYEPGCYSGLTAEGGLMLKVKHVFINANIMCTFNSFIDNKDTASKKLSGSLGFGYSF